MSGKHSKEYTPYLSTSMIAQQACEDLREFQRAIGRPIKAPIYPDEIAEILWGVEIRYLPSVEDNKGAEVLACFCPDKNIILVNDSGKGTEGRLSFTLAHEVGHVSLHSFLAALGDSRNMCRAGDKESTMDTKAEMIERQADRYASFLLMPEHLIRQAVGGGLLGGNGSNVVDMRLQGPLLAEHFKVSLQALEIRLQSLGFELRNTRYIASDVFVPYIHNTRK